MNLPLSDEQLLASATSFLIDGQEFYEASILLLCKIETSIDNEYRDRTEIVVELAGNRAIYDILQNQKDSATVAINRAFDAVMPTGYVVTYIRPRVELPNFGPDWRSQLQEVVEGKVALNQCLPIQDKPRYPWENLLFRSPYEIAVAKALDEHQVLFLPNCMARFTKEQKNREADFLVCYDGKWGIIEVDGETYHLSAAKDHERDRLFRSHGIRVIERFTADQCIKDPKGVVRQFLDLLKKNG